ncbi:hypothetical protein PG990_009539 [Apiospora arundinis]
MTARSSAPALEHSSTRALGTTMTSAWQHGFKGVPPSSSKPAALTGPAKCTGRAAPEPSCQCHVCALTWLHGFPESNGAMRQHRSERMGRGVSDMQDLQNVPVSSISAIPIISDPVIDPSSLR